MNYRIRSRIVKGAPARTWYLQEFAGLTSGLRMSWRSVFRAGDKASVERYLNIIRPKRVRA